MTSGPDELVFETDTEATYRAYFWYYSSINGNSWISIRALSADKN